MNSDNHTSSVLGRLSRKTRSVLKQAAYRLDPLEDRFLEAAHTPPCETFSVDFKARASIVGQFEALAAQYGATIPERTICDCFFDEKIRSRTVLLLGLGKGVRGNLQYILNELNYNAAFDGYRIYVRTSPETEDTVRDYITRNHWSRTETVSDNQLYSTLMESAEYLLTETYFPEGWVKKDGQVSVNIWHGTPLKKLGLAKNQKNKHGSGVIQKNFIDADYLLYPNEYTREKMLASYRVAPLLNGRALMLGYPRTGGMLAAARGDLSDVRRQLAPNGETIYAYMPTFRDYLERSEAAAQTCSLLDFLDAHLRPDQILYVNLHHRVSDSLDYSRYEHIRRFPPELDSYRLLAASAALITDYSSVFFDYLALQKQIILYIEDFQEYTQKRGMYMDLRELPFDRAASPQELLAALNRGKSYDDTEALAAWCPYDAPDNAEKLCRLFRGSGDGLRLKPFPRDEKKRFLIYSEAFEPELPTQLLSRFVSLYNSDRYELYLSCDASAVNADKSGAYPMMLHIPVIGTDPASHPSALGKALRKLYREGTLSFDEVIEYLKYDYAAAGLRMYGHARFDAVLLYDIDNPEKLLALTTLDAPKLLFLPERILEKIRGGDRLLTDAVRYVSGYCSRIYVGSASALDYVRSFLPERTADHIELLELSKKL